MSPSSASSAGGTAGAAGKAARDEVEAIDLGPAALPVDNDASSSAAALHAGRHGGPDEDEEVGHGQAQDDVEYAEEDEEGISSLHDNLLRESHTIDDFARIISEWRSERGTPHKQRGAGGQGGAAPSIRSGHLDVDSLSLRRKGSASSLASHGTEAGGGARRSLDVGDEYYDDGASSVGSYQDEHQTQSSASPSASPLTLLARGVGQRGSLGGAGAGAGSSRPPSAAALAAAGGGGPSSSSASSSTAQLEAGAKVRCTCCCGRGTRRCRRARRATREWAEMEGDLRLAAEIGQALLRRSDALQSALSQSQSEHSSRIDSLMKKLTSSIREASRLEKRLEQADLNLEAADASNRALVRELDDCRRELARLKQTGVKSAGLQEKLERARLDVEDAKQELVAERRRADRAESRAKSMEKRSEELSASLRLAKLDGLRAGQGESDEARLKRREEMAKIARERVAASTGGGGDAEADEDGVALLDHVVADNETMQRDNEQLKQLLDGCNDEIARLREELAQRDETMTLRSSSVGPSSKRFGDGSLHDKQTGEDEGQVAALSEEIIEATPVKSKISAYRPNLPRSVGSSAGSVSGADADADVDGSTTTATTATTTATTATTATSTRPLQSSTEEKPSLLAAPSYTATAKRELRTAQLVNLTDHVQRLFTRLAQADVDTLARRLQRQHLAGDVGHLARTTVNGILRDADGLRDHFKRLIDAESRSRDADASSLGSSSKGSSTDRESESLVARKEFFALVKVFKDLFFEMARLRNAVNEVHLNPSQASRILGEQLGLNGGQEDKGVMGAWLGRLFSGPTNPSVGSSATVASSAPVPSQPTPSTTSLSSSTTNAAPARPSNLRRPPSRGPSGSHLAAPRASAAVVSSTVAVEIKGTTHASAASEPMGTPIDDAVSEASSSTPPISGGSGGLQAGPRPEGKRTHPHSLSRTQSRNLSGLFAGSIPTQSTFAPGPPPSSAARAANTGNDTTNYRLSRIVDDDEISIRDGFVPERTLRPRGLSDSSIRSSFLDDDPNTTSPAKNKAKAAAGAASRGEGQGPSPISRIITPSTLALQVNSTAPSGTLQSQRQQAAPPSSAAAPSPSSSSSMFPKALGFLSAAGTGATFGLPSLRSTSSSSNPAVSPTASSTSSATARAGTASTSSSSHIEGMPRGGRMAF